MAEPLPFPYQKSLYVWKVKNIFLCTSGESEVLSIGGIECKLFLKLLRDSFSNMYYFICLERIGEKPLSLTSKISAETYIEDCDGMHIFRKNGAINLQGYEKHIWCTSFDDLHAESDRIVTDGMVTFVINLEYKCDSFDNKIDREGIPIQTSLPVDPIHSLESLSFDLKRILDDREYSDVTLTCKGQTFAAHRVILCARSEVFSAMLRNDMSENRYGVIIIVNMDPAILNQLIQFIYTGSIPELTSDTVQQLYEAADKYAIESLKKQCSDFMTENFNKMNIYNILVIADAHCDEDLKKSAISFIECRHLLNDTWDKFQTEHPALAEEVYSQVFAAKCSSE